ncbi:hypothetical protein C8J56DRAFT_1045524 [Mycena floridula]|nr:hypothetical protein C8J56DRAFT_1045524 [Mycena floridula]
MKPPLNEAEHPVGLLWQAAEVSGRQNAYAGGSQAVPWSADSHQGSDTDSAAIGEQQGTYAQDIQAIVARLQEAYRAGQCSLHPNTICFPHKASNQHFDLGFRARAVQWASKIRSGELDDTRIPLGVAFFSASHAIKKQKPRAIEPTPGPSFPSPYGTMPSPYFSPYGGFPGYQPGFPSFNPDNHPITSTIPSKRCRESSPDMLMSSSPPRGDETDMSVEDFCAKYKLDQDTCTHLIKLHWSVDYPPKCVSSDRWEKVGFTEISWNRVLKAYKCYQRCD